MITAMDETKEPAEVATAILRMISDRDEELTYLPKGKRDELVGSTLDGQSAFLASARDFGFSTSGGVFSSVLALAGFARALLLLLLLCSAVLALGGSLRLLLHRLGCGIKQFRGVICFTHTWGFFFVSVMSAPV
jgi:hypothetical protein